ncbi:MAG: TIGR01777 family oxidoreductase [Bacteroidota bacterium]
MRSITIAGGSGFLGGILEKYFKNKGFIINILTRNPKRNNEYYWNGTDLGEWQSVINGTDILINLAGRSVDCRYNDKNKKEILDSRVNSTHVLALAINLSEPPPKIWINSSTATIYNSSLEKQMTERNGDIGDDFSMNVAKSWEAAFNSTTNPKTRKLILRTAIVLGKKGGPLKPLKQLTKLGLGGKQGSGQQKVSWIHENDFARAIEFLINAENLRGSFNLSTPTPITNIELMSGLRKALGIPIGLSQPKSLIEFGAKLIGTEAELVLKSRNVIPERLLENGFVFLYDDIEMAFKNLLSLKK